MSWTERTELLIGGKAQEKLAEAYVAVFGIGGVGSFASEALARAGVGRFLLCDADIVAESNINRQLIALRGTIGRLKTTVMKERILDINPHASVIEAPIFYNEETAGDLHISGVSYIIDAIDTVSSKLLLIEYAKRNNIPIISCMGAGNKLNPTMFEVSDIYKTSVCPLARVMRRELKVRNINSLKVVYSKEPPISPQDSGDVGRKKTPGSISFVPSVAGLILAGEVACDIAGIRNQKG